ncbi:MAG: methylmalonyl-CoA mutase subunit beta [Croceivirga sp.]
MSKTNLFSVFEPVSVKQWKQKIQVDLNGADYNQELVWESLEGIKVKPFYTKDDVTGLTSFPLPENHRWYIGQNIYAGNTKAANKKAKDVIQRGANALIFDIPDSDVDWSILFDNIPLDSTPLQLNVHFLEMAPLQRLKEFIGQKSCKIYLHLDIIGNLAQTGNWYHNLKDDHKLMEEVVQLMNTNTNASILSIDTTLYQNAGANMIQQLAYGLAHANEYLNHFNQVLHGAKEKKVVFRVGIGPNYFFEIAKLRAFRWLWKTLAKAYDLTKDCHILATPSKRNKTLYDYNVNMLRTTSESMAAVLGGADTVCNLPYDAIYHKDNEFGERISRNQLLLLKEESYLNEAVKASEGTYYIEVLTKQLAEKALDLFKRIEASGGFLRELKKGTIQKKIKESAAKEQAMFDEGKLVLLGTNKYQNPDDRMKENLELFPFLKQKTRKTLIPPILEKRLAETLEQNRLKEE